MTSSTKIRPLGNRILIRILEENAQTDSGILLPTQNYKNNLHAQVKAVSEGVSEISIDDIIYVQKEDLISLGVECQQTFLIDEKNVLAKRCSDE